MYNEIGAEEKIVMFDIEQTRGGGGAGEGKC